MKRLEIIVVDDSVIEREVISSALAKNERLNVVCVARNGKDALSKLEAIGADALILDLNMPEMDGFELLSRIRGLDRAPGVIVVSGSESPADRKRALESGALAFVQKPGSGRATNSIGYLEELVAELEKLAGPVPPATPRSAKRSSPSAAVMRTDLPATAPTGTSDGACERRGTPPARVDVVVVGASTGGPDALHTFISSLPKSFRTPLLITQHMPPGFTTQFAQRLNRASHLDIQEAAGGEFLEPGRAYLAPGGHHMVVRRGSRDPRPVVGLDDGPPENSCRPAADPMFRSAVEVFDSHVLAVIFTGMGMDGFAGSQLVSDRGGWVMAQDQQSSVVWGMPGYVARAGIADRIVPLDRMAFELSRALGVASASRS